MKNEYYRAYFNSWRAFGGLFGFVLVLALFGSVGEAFAGTCDGSGTCPRGYFTISTAGVVNTDSVKANYLTCSGSSNNSEHHLYKSIATSTSGSISGGTYSGADCGTVFGAIAYNLSAQTDGDYWFWLDFNGVKKYFTMVRSGGVWSTPLANYTPHFDSFVISTSTKTALITGYWTASSTIHFFKNSDIYGQDSYQAIVSTTTGDFSLTLSYFEVPPPSYVSTSTPLITANDVFYAEIYDTSTDPITLLEATTTTSTGNPLGYDLASTSAIFNYPPPEECGITHLDGCIKNVLVWTFFPSKDTISNFQTLGTYITIKAPIGYFTLIKNTFTGLSATGTVTATITIPQHLKDIIFHPFDLAIGALLWFFFIIHFYKRLKTIQI